MNDDNHNSSPRPAQSAGRHEAATGGGFGVAASPFNGVKLELAITLILGIVLGLLVDSITHRDEVQIAVLASYGIAAGCWIWFRTRQVLARVVAQDAARRAAPEEAASESARTPLV